MRLVAPVACLLLGACAALAPRPAYPPTPRGDVVDEYFGTRVPDPYRWLEDPDSPETMAWVAAQNRVSRPLLDALPARVALKQRLEQLWRYEQHGVPLRTADGALVYTRHDGVQDHAVLYIEEAGRAPRVLVDPNRWAEDGTVALAHWTVSPDGRWLLYAKQTAGSDWVEYRLRDIVTGQDGPDRLEGINFNFDASRISWRGGPRGFVYSRFSGPGAAEGAPPEITHQKVYYHRVGTPQSEDVLVFEQPRQPRWFAFGEVTDDGRYLLVYQERTEDSEKQVWVKDLRDPARPRLEAPLRRIVTGWDGRYHLVGNVGSTLYFRTSFRAPNQRIVRMDVSQERPLRYAVVPASDDAMQFARLIGREIVVGYLHDAASRVVRYARSGENLGEIALPGLGTVSGLQGRPDRNELYYSYASFSQPPTAYRHHLTAGTTQAFRAPALAFDPARFRTEQVFVTSADGTRVPMFISYRADLPRDRPAPTLLYGYGGFSNALTPSFSVPNLVWMERGGIYAQASLRGGSEYGEAWHRAGTLGRKQNVFDDFIAAAEYLVAEKRTTPAQLAIRGRSNGGLLVGAVLNQRPGLFAAAHAAVGVLDMLRYHRFGIAHAWAGDYGTSETPEGFRYLSAYSPVHNARPARYPAVLLTTADHDDRVHPLHTFKYAAALQAAQAGGAPILLRVETSAGHGGGTGLSKLIEENADVLAFLERYTGGR